MIKQLSCFEEWLIKNRLGIGTKPKTFRELSESGDTLYSYQRLQQIEAKTLEKLGLKRFERR